MYLVSHIAGRSRLKFTNLTELYLFSDKMKLIPGIESIEPNVTVLTVLIKYEIGSPLDYILQKMVSKPHELKLSKEDVSAYITPLLANPITKALWLIALFGTTVGFLQFSISSMIVNKYIQAKFG